MPKAVLTTGSISTHLLKLTLPALVGILCTFSFTIVDTYFISLLGQNELAAISYSTPMIDIIIGVAIGIGIAISSIGARMFGSGDFENIKIFIFHAFLFCLFLSLIITIFGILNIDTIFKSLGAAGNTLVEIHNFMIVWFLGVFPLFMIFVCSNALRANGKAKGPAKIQIYMAILNLVLDPIFIFSLNLGIMGAAIAGLISRFAGLFILLRILIKEDMITFDYQNHMKGFLLSWNKIIKMSVPACLANMIGPLATFWITYLLSIVSQFAVAGFGVATKIQMIAVIPMFALSGSIGPIIGQNFSAKKWDRSFLTLKISSIFSIFWGVFISLLLLVLAPYLSRVFSDNLKVTEVSDSYMYIVPVSYIGWGIIMMVCANFNSLGKPIRSTLISLFRMLILFMPLSYFMFNLYSFKGVFISFNISTLFVAGVAFFWAYKDYKGYGS